MQGHLLCVPGTGEAATLRPKQPKVKVTAEALQGGKLAQIGTVIETRFSASERKVYKNFAHNLVLFIKGTEAESARDPDVMQRLQKIRNIVFITQLLGVIRVEQYAEVAPCIVYNTYYYYILYNTILYYGLD